MADLIYGLRNLSQGAVMVGKSKNNPFTKGLYRVSMIRLKQPTNGRRYGRNTVID